MDDADILGRDDPEGTYDADDDGGGLLAAVTAPEALALASVVLAVLSLSGTGLLNGSVYLPGLYSSSGPEDRLLAAAAALGAALALLPVVLGAVALRRLQVGSRPWVLAAAGVLLGGLAVVLRLTAAGMSLVHDGPSFPAL